MKDIILPFTAVAHPQPTNRPQCLEHITKVINVKAFDHNQNGSVMKNDKGKNIKDETGKPVTTSQLRLYFNLGGKYSNEISILGLELEPFLRLVAEAQSNDELVDLRPLQKEATQALQQRIP